MPTSRLAVPILLATAAMPLPPAPAAGATTEWASVTSAGGQADGASFAPSLSGDGRLVAFETETAGNLVPRDTNGVNDIFVRVLGGPGSR